MERGYAKRLCYSFVIAIQIGNVLTIPVYYTTFIVGRVERNHCRERYIYKYFTIHDTLLKNDTVSVTRQFGHQPLKIQNPLILLILKCSVIFNNRYEIND